MLGVFLAHALLGIRLFALDGGDAALVVRPPGEEEAQEERGEADSCEKSDGSVRRQARRNSRHSPAGRRMLLVASTIGPLTTWGIHVVEQERTSWKPKYLISEPLGKSSEKRTRKSGETMAPAAF